MAYSFNEDAYYGDMKPQYVPAPIHHHGGGGGGSGDITELDFSRIKVYNAPWLGKKTLQQMVADLAANPKTLNQTIELLDELIERMKQCATVSAASVAEGAEYS